MSNRVETSKRKITQKELSSKVKDITAGTGSPKANENKMSLIQNSTEFSAPVEVVSLGGITVKTETISSKRLNVSQLPDSCGCATTTGSCCTD